MRIGLFLMVLCFSLASPLWGQEITAPGATTADQPYGCFRDYRWSMSVEDVQSMLGDTLEPFKFDQRAAAFLNLLTASSVDVKDRYHPLPSKKHREKLGETQYYIFFRIGAEGLYEIDLIPEIPAPLGFLGMDLDPYWMVRGYTQEYVTIREALVQKFGPANKTWGDEQIEYNLHLMPGVAFNLVHLRSEWYTAESTIILTCSFNVPPGGGIPRPEGDGALLIYKKRDQSAPVNIDL